MNVSEVFIRRPVMTTLVMLAILVFGVIGFRRLPVNNLPRVDYPTISVSASLPGANPETMAATVATPLERQFATISGIDSMNSTSTLGSTTITIQFSLSRNIDAAAQDVQTAISAALRLLPPLPQRPSFRKVNPADAPILFMSLSSATQPLSTVDEYAETLVAQRLSMVDGVAQVAVYGSQKFAVRAQVNPDLLASRGIGIDQVARAISAGNVKNPTGTLYGPHTMTSVRSNDQLPDAAAMRPLIVTYRRGAPVRLGDVGNVIDSVENNKVANWCRNGRTVVLAVQRQPDTNTVDIIDRIKGILPLLRAEIPVSVQLGIMFDRSISIRDSVHDVERTLLITMGLVIMVIFVFLRNVTATVIPSLALPMSIIGTFAVMALLGFSLNDLSLMGLTLCVGFVVDDAIVVLENIVRHMEMGESAMAAALQGTKEISFTIVSMTTSLVAVFIPILFMGGILGRLFNEFAVTITAAILISGFVSLSLTPMLCSRFLAPSHEVRHGVVSRTLERLLDGARHLYDAMLCVVLRWWPLTLLASVALFGVTAYMFVICPKGFIPTVDIGQIMGNTEAPQDVSFDYMVAHQLQVKKILSEDPNVADFMVAVGGGGGSSTINTGRMFIMLKPLPERKRTADQVVQELRRKFSKVTGLRVFLQNPPAIRIGGQQTRGLYQFTLQSLDLPSLYQAVAILQAKIGEIPDVQDPNTDLQTKSLQAMVEVDRDRASSLGLTARQIDSALSNAYSTRQISTIYTPRNEYQVIIEVDPRYDRSPDMLSRLYVSNGAGRLIPLSAIARVNKTVGPLQINHLSQLPSATISFNLKPGASLGDAVKRVQDVARQNLPDGVTASFQGNALAFQSSLQNLTVLLGVAIMVIYIVLGILYESFAHPVTILAGLPSAGLGALLTLMLFHVDLDVYGFLGLLMLLGIVKKNAIMMIDHAVEVERSQGLSARDAVREACMVRFRPIMMTTMAALMGSLPIAIGLGAGGEARQPLGLAVVGGLMVSQVLTLFITPVVYVFIDLLSSVWRRQRGRMPRVAGSRA